MPPQFYTYWIPLLAVTAYALLRGGGPERVTAALIIVAALLTVAFQGPFSCRFRHVPPGVLIIDIALFAALAMVALRANRWWPLLFAALQAIGVLGHLGRMQNPELLQLGYAIMLALPAYFHLPILATGTYLHRHRLRSSGADPSWRTSLNR